MKTKTLLTTIVPLLLVGGASGENSDVWKYYERGYEYNETQKYDSTFGMSLKGAYAWSTDDMLPDVYGGLLDLHNYMETGSVRHQISLGSGFLGGSENISQGTFDRMINPILATDGISLASQYLGMSPQQIIDEIKAFGGDPNHLMESFRELGIDAGAKVRLTAIPILPGYTFNVPLSDSVMVYVGGKIGATYSRTTATVHVSYRGESLSAKIKDSSFDFTYGVNAGIKVAVSQSTDFVIGYELLKVENSEPFHAVVTGLSWNF